MSAEHVARGAIVAVASGIALALAMAGGAVMLGASANNASALGAYGLLIYPTVACLAWLCGVMLGRRVVR